MSETYTQIPNNILEALITSNLSAAELRVALAILRKINGYHKESDQISYSQLIESTGLSRQSIANSLAQLRLVKIIRLVKKGVSKKVSNEWAFEQNPDKWQLVKRSRLVKWNASTSQKSSIQLVNTSRHTKENYKRNIITKESINTPSSFEKSKEQMLADVKAKYPNKNCELALEDFIGYIQANKTKYKDYRLAFFNWVRTDRFNKYAQQPVRKFSDITF